MLQNSKLQVVSLRPVFDLDPADLSPLSNATEGSLNGTSDLRDSWRAWQILPQPRPFLHSFYHRLSQAF